MRKISRVQAKWAAYRIVKAQSSSVKMAKSVSQSAIVVAINSGFDRL
ncbi:hypothetical protein GCM10009129_18690 [Psychrobacter aestuarii]|uniref:ESPR domain-containing protein n=1 Tax=Psychrobacter aestuarii TaxID=556327 RepID=A0ABP3FM23_9GAMM